MFGKPTKEKLLAMGANGKLEKLRPFLENKDISVRTAAAEAIGLINTDESSNALILALRDTTEEMQIAVVKALGNSSYQPAEEQLRQLFKRTSSETLKELCLEAIKSIESHQ